MSEVELGSRTQASPPFGTVFSPSMLTAQYEPAAGWHAVEIGPRQALSLDPATMALHYGQAVFEGVMAHRQAGGGWAVFRAGDYAARLVQSAARMAIPGLDAVTCVNLWRQFVAHEASRLDAAVQDLYLRPLVFGNSPRLGDQPSETYQMVVLGVIHDPSTPPPLEVLVTDRFVRASPGGVGMAKVPGNYGAGMLARQVAAACGCDQVLWLDAGRHRWIEELGSMNVAFVLSDTLVTPNLTDTILAGVTRQTMLTLVAELGLEYEERPIALEEITAALGWKGLTEAIGCGTAAGIVSIGAFRIGDHRLQLPAATPVADRLRQALDDYRHGRLPDQHGWLTAV